MWISAGQLVQKGTGKAFGTETAENFLCVKKCVDHWKFGKLEIQLVRVSLAIGQWQWARLSYLVCWRAHNPWLGSAKLLRKF